MNLRCSRWPLLSLLLAFHATKSFGFIKSGSRMKNIFRKSPSRGASETDGSPVATTPSLTMSAVQGGSADFKVDTERYNLLASADVALSDPFVFQGVLSVVRSSRDVDNKKRRKYLYTIPIPQGQGFFPFSIPPQEMSETTKARVPSPSGRKICVLREQGNNNDKQQQVLEIWTNECEVLENRIVLPSKLHGKVVNDPNWFGQISWNQEETALVYSAERKTPKVASFFDLENDTDGDKIRGGENTLGLGKMENWGEKYTDMSALLDLFVVNTESGKVARVDNVPGGVDDVTTHGGFTLGQARFSPCDTHVVYTAWDAGGGSEMPRRLGMVYCSQRPSKIYASPVSNLMEELATVDTDKEMNSQDSAKIYDKECICLTQGARISRSPRFSPEANGISKMVYLCSKLGFDTHDGSVALHVQDWNVTECAPDLDSQNIWISTVNQPPPLSGDVNSGKNVILHVLTFCSL